MLELILIYQGITYTTVFCRSFDDLDSESNSAPWTSAPNADHDHFVQGQSWDHDGFYIPSEPRRTYSREEFLHDGAATGGPNVAMRIR